MFFTRVKRGYTAFFFHVNLAIAERKTTAGKKLKVAKIAILQHHYDYGKDMFVPFTQLPFNFYFYI